MSRPSTFRIVLASRNRKKIAEIREQLAPLSIETAGLDEFPDVPEIIEDGETFAENAAIKARTVSQALRIWSIGEDSGLEVDALGGAPGVYSARYAGEPCDDERNNRKLIDELSGAPDETRTAAYVCSVAVSDPAGEISLTAQARCRGRITRAARGSGGFGYDPYFLIPELHRTFGELSAVVKRHLSHRARAFEQLLPALARLRS